MGDIQDALVMFQHMMGYKCYWLYKSKIDLNDGSENILYNRLNKGAAN